MLHLRAEALWSPPERQTHRGRAGGAVARAFERRTEEDLVRDAWCGCALVEEVVARLVAGQPRLKV